MPDQDMLINYVPGEECRIAIVEDGKLEELYTERASDDIHVGNIYRGRITNIEPSIQAAFVDFGLDRNGFLHISDLHPRYFGSDDDAVERVGKRTPRRDRPPIQQALKRGQQILVQVLKEGIGSKGPTLTSYLSIPGRFLVMMPDMERHGVSRKIDDEEQRREIRRILDELNPPDDFGFIVRTAGMGRTKTELKRDLAYLIRLWKQIERRRKGGGGPAELYRESDLVIRTLRDVLTSDVKRIIVDDDEAAKRARDFMRIALPRGATKVIQYDKHIPLFDAFDIERQIENIGKREVPLPSGGSLVVDTTEAMVAIDVNSGKFRDKGDAESTAYHTNQEAVDEIARQLRLRDLGGVVVLDLIDMYQNKHRREIERRFRELLKKDRARSKTLKINELGLLSLTRQRMRPSLKRSLHTVCPTCEGQGIVRTYESVALEVMRQVAVVLSADRVHRITVTIRPEVGQMLLNRKRGALQKLENTLEKRVEMALDNDIRPDEMRLVAYDSRGIEVDVDSLPRPKPPKFDENDELDTRKFSDDEPPIESEEDSDDTSASDDTDEQSTGDENDKPSSSRRRKRRRGGRGRGKSRTNNEDPSDQTDATADKDQTESSDDSPKVFEPGKASDESESSNDSDNSDDSDEQPKKKRRRRRGGRRHRKKSDNDQANEPQPAEPNG